MEYASFDELFASLDVSLAHSRMVIAAPDENSVEVAAMVQREGIADPLFTGNRALIEKTAESLGLTIAKENIIDAENDEDAARKAVGLIREGKADFLMKGHLDTKVILKAVVDKEQGIRGNGIISHFSIF